MKDKPKAPAPRSQTAGAAEGDQLDTLNARLRGRSDSSHRIRRAIEGEIDAKAQRERRREAAASSRWKK